MKEPALESPPEGESGEITGEEDVLGSPPCLSLASSEGGFGQTQELILSKNGWFFLLLRERSPF